MAAANCTGDPLRNLRDAAAYLTLSTRTLEGLVAAGAIEFVRVSARRIAFRQSFLDQFVRARTQPARAK
jgi:excisionase family DNA binding protein